MAAETPAETSVAIIGAGISGLILGLALHERRIPFQIYEQSSGFNQFGAGMNMNPAGIRALRTSSAAALEAFEKVRTPHHPTREDFYFAYTDGERTVELHTKGGIAGLKRSSWIEELSKALPAESVQFRKRLKDLGETSDKPIALRFEDGNTTYADAVVGCDGIKSKIRSSIVGDHPSTIPSFAHAIVYRSLMSKKDASRLIEPSLAECAHFRAGKGMAYVSYPITGGSHNSFAMFKQYDGEWPHYPNLSISRSKKQLLENILDPSFKDFAESLSDDLDVWAVYDSHQSPLPTYVKGRLVVLGDAAHASSPNLGAGATMAVEDAAVLAELLAKVYTKVPMGGKNLYSPLVEAFAVYSDTRMHRTQWLVEASRHLGMANLSQPVHEGAWNWDVYERDIRESYHKVWDWQIDEAISKAKSNLQGRLQYQELPN